MSGSLASRAALGFGLLLIAGLSMTMIPSSGGPTSVASSGQSHPLPVPASPQANAVAPKCYLSANLVALPNSTSVHHPVQFVTLVSAAKTGPTAICPPITGFVYVNLPYGCVTRNAPTLFCMTQTPGVFHTTVHVLAPGANLQASATVTVAP